MSHSGETIAVADTAQAPSRSRPKDLPLREVPLSDSALILLSPPNPSAVSPQNPKIGILSNNLCPRGRGAIRSEVTNSLQGGSIQISPMSRKSRLSSS